MSLRLALAVVCVLAVPACTGRSDVSGSDAGIDARAAIDASDVDAPGSDAALEDASVDARAPSDARGSDAAGSDAGQADAGPVIACGGRGSPPCATGTFCDFPISSFCGRADGPGVCREIPGGCIPEGDGVCGCDGETYSNACLAASEGVSVEHDGACGVAPGGPYDCNPTVTCRRLAPTCASGEAPYVIDTDGFRCWGECVPIAECACTEAADCPTPYTCGSSGSCG